MKFKFCPGCGKDISQCGYFVVEGRALCYDCARKMDLEICMVCLNLYTSADFVSDGSMQMCTGCAAKRGLNNCQVCNDFTRMCDHDTSVCDDCHINSVRFAEQRK